MKMKTEQSETIDSKESNELKEKKLAIWIGFAKFFLGTFILGLTATYINSQIQSREIELKEMERLGQFINHALEEKVGVRLRFSQYFSTVTRSDILRERWKEYNQLVEKEYKETTAKKEKKEAIERELEESQRKGKEVGEELNNVRRQIIQLENELKSRRDKPYETIELKSPITVHIYWHEKGLTLKYAEGIKEELNKKGIKTIIMQHRDPNPPDSIFIGALVNAEDARTVLSKIPYDVEYIFPIDYPRDQGGDPDGFLIGIGYMSTHALKHRIKESTPIKVSKRDMASLIETRLSNTQFQKKLRSILLFR